MKHLSFSLLFCLLSLCSNSSFGQDSPIIPQPQSIRALKGSCALDKLNRIVITESSQMSLATAILKTLESYLEKETSIVLSPNLSATLPGKNNEILLTLNKQLGKEEYQLNINSKSIEIIYGGEAGGFYAMQSLLQLAQNAKESNKNKIACQLIEDAPRVSWRGMHLDVSRHFFPIDSIKRYIDVMAIYKMNTLHWHLTDDQGWRIEIKKYPKLTQIGSKRKETMIAKNFFPFIGDDTPYGGYYTQEQIKELVQYAAAKHITIVPEIEMPGHALAALAAYPEYSCNGGPFETLTKWGISEDVFCPKEETFVFLKDILSEVMQLFPSSYIHIGGDEVPKTRWKTCPHCQGIIKAKGLKDENELQSYFIHRIDSFITASGRHTLGWDEILEGGLAPGAAVMSWRGIQGGIEAAKQHHEVIMCPGTHCYFDHYQGYQKTEPLAIGGYTTVQKAYQFNPIPSGLSTEEESYILGGQANIWTEYIPTWHQVEYMLLPRMLALSEALWTKMPQTGNGRDFDRFLPRLLPQMNRLQKEGYTVAQSIYDLQLELQAIPDTNGIRVSLKSPFKGGQIHYTLNDSLPKLSDPVLSGPIDIYRHKTMTAAYFENGVRKGNIWKQTIWPSGATGKKVSFDHAPSPSYNYGGSLTINDGIIGDRPWYGRDWLGWSGDDVSIVIDLGSKKPILHTYISTLKDEPSWIYGPKEVAVYVSDDNLIFTQVMKYGKEEIKMFNEQFPFFMNGWSGRYVRVDVKNQGIIPEGKNGAGEKAWLFIDEIMIFTEQDQ
ncbi:MAG: hypothetical protein RL138_830 [Bacteroidota bacterium]